MLSDKQVKDFIDQHIEDNDPNSLKHIYNFSKKLVHKCFDELYIVMNDKEDLPKTGCKYKHECSGNLYTVIAVTNTTISPFRKDEYPTTVVYMNDINLEIFSRPLYNWKGKFTLVEK